MTTAYDVETLLAVQGVRQALALHSQGVDRADAPLLQSAYHEDASVDYGFFKGPAEEFAPVLCGAQRQAPVTLHRTSPPWVRVNGSRALSESYVLACAEAGDEGDEEGGTVQRLIGGRYLDRLSCREGRWRLDHRHYVLDWNMNRPGRSDWPGTGALLGHHVPRGGHAESDPGRALLAMGSARPNTEEKAMSADNREHQLEQALARLAMHDLLMAYARGVDRADSDLLASTFHPDATVISGVFNGAGPDFAREITAHVRANLERCFHSVANEWFEVDGNRGVGEAYVIAHMTAGGTDTVTGGRYISEFECRDGEWKISSHTFVSDWNMNLPTTFQNDGLYAALDSRGCFGKDDPVYRFWDTA